jgi:3-hydroxyacyl-CoA dehydrogenase
MTTTNTSARRTTKREYYNILLGIEAVANNPELKAFIENELELLAKKSSSTSSKPTTKQNQNGSYKNDILAYLGSEEDKQATITEMWKNIESLANDETMTNQRVSALVRQLIEEQRVERVVEKRVAYFKLV